MVVLVIFLACVVYACGFAMGIICASRKRKNETKPCETLQDVIDREG